MNEQRGFFLVDIGRILLALVFLVVGSYSVRARSLFARVQPRFVPIFSIFVVHSARRTSASRS